MTGDSIWEPYQHTSRQASALSLLHAYTDCSQHPSGMLLCFVTMGHDTSRVMVWSPVIIKHDREGNTCVTLLVIDDTCDDIVG